MAASLPRGMWVDNDIYVCASTSNPFSERNIDNLYYIIDSSLPSTHE